MFSCNDAAVKLEQNTKVPVASSGIIVPVTISDLGHLLLWIAVNTPTRSSRRQCHPVEEMPSRSVLFGNEWQSAGCTQYASFVLAKSRPPLSLDNVRLYSAIEASASKGKSHTCRRLEMSLVVDHVLPNIFRSCFQ